MALDLTALAVSIACLPRIALALPAETGPGQAEVSATAGETIRQDIVVTNQNLAVVTETRPANLPAGRVRLAWPRIGASMRTETWSLTNTRDASVRFLGLASPAAPAGSPGLVGRTVRIERPGGGSVDARIVAVGGPTSDQMVFREGDSLVYGEPGARLVLTDAGDMTPTDAAVLRLESARAGSRSLTARYLLGDLGWQADYALSLSADEKSARLEGWFTIDNHSGVELAPTRLRLLAGTLRVASSPPSRLMMQGRVAGIGGVATSEAVSEARMYEIPSPPRLTPGRTTLALAENAQVPVERKYLVASPYAFGQSPEGQPLPVEVRYRVGAKTLAAALPAGTVRVYTDGGTVFAGEDRIAQTPERTDFEIAPSEAFDLTARRRQASYRQLAPSDSESELDVVVTSRKKEDAVVVVRDTFPGEWTLLASSVPPGPKSAHSVDFAVSVPAGGEAHLTYRVRVRISG